MLQINMRFHRSYWQTHTNVSCVKPYTWIRKFGFCFLVNQKVTLGVYKINTDISQILTNIHRKFHVSRSNSSETIGHSILLYYVDDLEPRWENVVLTIFIKFFEILHKLSINFAPWALNFIIAIHQDKYFFIII